jgi:osmotically-inducible protein OsmY
MLGLGARKREALLISAKATATTGMRMRAAVLGVWLAVLAGCAPFGECGLRGCSADTKISAEVRALLAQSPSLGAPNQVRVETVHGVVYLRGLVSTPYQIAEAASIAEQAAGVTDVQNLLSIDNSH